MAWRTTGFCPDESQLCILVWNLGWKEPRVDIVRFESGWSDDSQEAHEDEEGGGILPVYAVGRDEGEPLEFHPDTEYAWTPLKPPAKLGRWNRVEADRKRPKR